MRRYLTILTAVLLTTACTNRQATGTEDNDTLCGDSLCIEIDSIGVSVHFTAHLSESDTLFERALATFLSQQLFFDEEGTPICAEPPTYNCDYKAFLQACAQQKWQELEHDTFTGYPEELEDPEMEGLTAAEAREEAARASEEEDVYLSMANYTLRRVSENDSLVSWQYDYILNLAGTAHPSLGTSSITLRKADGTIFVPDLMSESPFSKTK